MTTVSQLYNAIKGLLEKDHPFRLHITPPPTDLDRQNTFWKQNLAPASIVHFLSDIPGPHLSKSALESSIDFPAPEPPSVLAVAEESEEEIPLRVQQADTSRPSSKSGKKVPKWFKLK